MWSSAVTLPCLWNRSVLLIGWASLTVKILVRQIDFGSSNGHSFTTCFIKLQTRGSVLSWLKLLSHSYFREMFWILKQWDSRSGILRERVKYLTSDLFSRMYAYHTEGSIRWKKLVSKTVWVGCLLLISLCVCVGWMSNWEVMTMCLLSFKPPF